MRYSNIAVLMLLTCGTALSAPSEEHRQHGVHEHGGGQLDVAIDKNTLMIDLSLPAMTVVGFEHPANNDDERSLIVQSANLLRGGMNLFMPSPAAKCVASQIKIESGLLENSANHDEEAHADFDVSYVFTCAEPLKLKALTLSLFKLFPATQHLRVQMITPTGQTGAEITAENYILDLK